MEFRVSFTDALYIDAYQLAYATCLNIGLKGDKQWQSAIEKATFQTS